MAEGMGPPSHNRLRPEASVDQAPPRKKLVRGSPIDGVNVIYVKFCKLVGFKKIGKILNNFFEYQ